MAQSPEIRTELVAEVRHSVSTASGARAWRFTPATVVAQGQAVYYTVRILNPATVYARDVVVTQRVPENTTYQEGSAAGPGAEILFSVDGGQTFARPEQLVIADAAGVVQRAAPEQYTHIQWRLRNALAPGAVALARFRAVFR